MKQSTNPSGTTINKKYKTLDVMNVRTGPSTGYSKKGTVPKGVIVQATKSSGNWVYATYGSITGWICVKDSSETYLVQVNYYTGSWPTLPSRGYFKSGDTGTQVTRVQAFLNWWGNCKLATDGVYGPKTIAAVKQFQKAAKITADGLFGKTTLAKAKAHLK